MKMKLRMAIVWIKYQALMVYNVWNLFWFKQGGLDYEDWEARYIKGCIKTFDLAEELGYDVSDLKKEFLSKVAMFGTEGWR